jgi:hypothetical protein
MIHIEEERRKGQKCKGNMFKCLFAPCLGYLQEEDLYVNLTFCMDWIDLQNVCWLNIVAAFRCLMWSEPLNGLKSFAWRDLAIFQEIWYVSVETWKEGKECNAAGISLICTRVFSV